MPAPAAAIDSVIGRWISVQPTTERLVWRGSRPPMMSK